MVIILLEIIAILGISYLLLRLIISVSKKGTSISTDKSNIEKSIKDGFISAVKELEYEKEQEAELFKTIKEKSNQSNGVYSSIYKKEELIDTKGDLIPMNITDNEKEILRMFYNEH